MSSFDLPTQLHHVCVIIEGNHEGPIWLETEENKFSIDISPNFGAIGSSSTVIDTREGSFPYSSVYWIIYRASSYIAVGKGNAPSKKSVLLLLEHQDTSALHRLSSESTIISYHIKEVKELSFFCSQNKWNPDRSLRTFKGNTVICNIEKASSFYENLVEIQNRVRESEFGYAFAFLPPETFHVTVASLVNENNYSKIVRKTAVEDIKWDRVNSVYHKKLALILKRYQNTHLNMKVDHVNYQPHFGVNLVPADLRTKQLLAKLKKEVFTALRLPMPTKNHPYHVSLSYGFLPLMPHLQESIASFMDSLLPTPIQFALQPPFFASFDNMGQFNPIRK